VIDARNKITGWGAKLAVLVSSLGAGAHNLLESCAVEPRRVDYITVSCIYSFYTTRICISNYINYIHFIEYSSIPRRARLRAQQTSFRKYSCATRIRFITLPLHRAQGYTASRSSLGIKVWIYFCYPCWSGFGRQSTVGEVY